MTSALRCHLGFIITSVRAVPHRGDRMLCPGDSGVPSAMGNQGAVCGASGHVGSPWRQARGRSGLLLSQLSPQDWGIPAQAPFQCDTPPRAYKTIARYNCPTPCNFVKNHLLFARKPESLLMKCPRPRVVSSVLKVEKPRCRGDT